MDKEKKKKIRRRVIAGVLAALVVAFFVRNSLVAKNTAPMVSTVAATVADVEQILSTGGTVTSDETRTYFAPVSVEVGEVKVSTGDTVKAGDVLLTFDENALAEEKQEAEYKLASNAGGYESSIHKDNQYIADLSEATVNLEVLDQQIADNENLLQEINKKIEDKKAGWSYNGTNLDVSILEWQSIVSEDEQNLANFKERRANGKLEDYTEEEMDEIQRELERQIQNDRDTLLVGGIGVMNIMLVSVTERTREIGIRKSLGARTKSILLQFLAEAGIITLIGGLIGIVLGAMGAMAVCGAMGFAAQVNVSTVIIAAAFSSGVGIFFGIYPARKAAKLSPIEALRHE